MKTILIILIGTAIVFCSFACAPKTQLVSNIQDATSEINFFSGTWNEALALAKKENKLVFVDFHAVWCGPCKRMKKVSFTDAEVANFFNQNFVNLYLEAEKGEGVEKANFYGVRAYPTLVFISPDGKVIKYVEGYHKPNELIRLGKEVLNK
jgi:thioredoxin 1